MCQSQSCTCIGTKLVQTVPRRALSTRWQWRSVNTRTEVLVRIWIMCALRTFFTACAFPQYFNYVGTCCRPRHLLKLVPSPTTLSNLPAPTVPSLIYPFPQLPVSSAHPYTPVSFWLATAAFALAHPTLHYHFESPPLPSHPHPHPQAAPYSITLARPGLSLAHIPHCSRTRSCFRLSLTHAHDAV